MSPSISFRTFKALRPFVICSCRRIGLIWLQSLSCKNSHLWDILRSLLFLHWKKGQREMHHVCLTPRSPLAIPENSYVFHTCCDQKPSRGLREQEVETSHLRYRNVISLTGWMSIKAPWPGGSWIGYDGCCTVSNCILQHDVTVHTNTTTCQGWRQNKIKKPQNLIILSWEPFSLPWKQKERLNKICETIKTDKGYCYNNVQWCRFTKCEHTAPTAPK